MNTRSYMFGSKSYYGDDWYSTDEKAFSHKNYYFHIVKGAALLYTIGLSNLAFSLTLKRNCIVRGNQCTGEVTENRVSCVCYEAFLESRSLWLILTNKRCLASCNISQERVSLGYGLPIVL